MLPPAIIHISRSNVAKGFVVAPVVIISWVNFKKLTPCPPVKQDRNKAFFERGGPNETGTFTCNHNWESSTLHTVACIMYSLFWCGFRLSKPRGHKFKCSIWFIEVSETGVAPIEVANML